MPHEGDGRKPIGANSGVVPSVMLTGRLRYDSGANLLFRPEIPPDWTLSGFPSRRSYVAPDPRSRSFI